MILVRVGEVWEQATLTSYGSEAELQALLAGDTSLLPGCAGAAACREVSVPGVGVVDLVCVDSDGVITLVECKLRANPQIRREVVGQVIAYASGLQGTSYESFDAAMAARAGISLAAYVSAAAGSPVDPEELRSSVSDRLVAGAFRLVVAVDQITDELRRSVEYLNEHLSDSVLIMALELGYLKHDGVEVLVPRTYGAEFEALRRREPSSKRRWTVEDVAAAANDVENVDQRNFVSTLLRHAEDHSAVVKGGQGVAPSAGYYYMAAGKRRSLWSLYVKPEGPVVAVNLGSVANGAPKVAQAMARELASSDALRERIGDPSASLQGKYPDFSVAALTQDPHALVALLAAFDHALASPAPLYLEPFTEQELASGWADRRQDLVLLVDWVTRRLLSDRPVWPMQVAAGFPKYRYVPSATDGANYAVGLRDASPMWPSVPVWLRYHHVTPGFHSIRDHLRRSRFSDELDEEFGNVWLPLPLPFGVRGDEVGEALVARVREIDEGAMSVSPSPSPRQL